MVARELGVVLPRTVKAIVNRIQSVISRWKWGICGNDISPFRDGLLNSAFPLNSRVETVTPVGNHICEITSQIWWGVLSDPVEGRTEIVSPAVVLMPEYATM